MQSSIPNPQSPTIVPEAKRSEISKKRRPLSWTLLFILWLAFALRVWQLGAQSLWYDEGYSVYLGAHLSPGQALDLTVRDVVPPLYYLILRGWLPLAGTSEFALRFLSVCFGVVAVALMAQIGRRLAGERGGLISAGLAAVAPVLVWLSRDARMYGPLVTWSLLASWGLLRAVAPAAVRRSRRRGWALFVGAGLAALYTHTVAAFWLLGQVCFGFLAIWRQRRQRERVIEALTALGLIAAGYLPWSIVALISYQTNAGYWPGHLPPAHLWRVAWETFVGGQHLPAAQTGPIALWFGITALLTWLTLLFKRPRATLYLFCYLVIPLLAMGIAFQNTPKLAPRYPTAMAPALLLTLATGAAIASRAILNTQYPISNTERVLGVGYWVCLLGAILFFLRVDANLLFDPDFGNDDWRAAADYVQAHREPDEAVLLISGHAFPLFAYYYGWQGWRALPDDVQLDTTHVLDYASVAPQLNQTLAGASGAWLVLWQDEVVDPTGLVPALLHDVAHERPVPTFRGASAGDRVALRHFVFTTAVRFPSELPVAHRQGQTVAPDLTNLGYTLPDEPLPADVEIPLRAFWRAEEPLQGAHAASLRLHDRLGQEWARQDTLLAGDYFSERWPVGTAVLGRYTVTLPLAAPPGTYTPTLRVYRGDESFETLRLPPLIITRPLTAPAVSALGLPPPANRRPPTAGHELNLVGIGFDQQTATPCQNWSLSLAWRAETRPRQDYRLRLSAGPDQVETPLAVDYATTRWQAGDLWRTRHHLPIDCRALDGTVPVTAQVLGAGGQAVGDPLDLGTLAVVAGRQFTLPTDLTSVLDVELPEVGVLAGYRLDKDRFQPGEKLHVTLYWRAGREIYHNYSVFVHLVGDAGPAGGASRVWAQHDGWPAQGQKPTTTWAIEEVIADRHTVTIGHDVPPGPMQLVVGMYDPETVQNLAASDPSGRLEGGRIVLQQITIVIP